MKLNAKEIRDLDEETTIAPHKRYPVYLILDNVYDTYNIGGLFRLGDALAITKLYICGESETPPNIKIKRASIGTYKIVPWEYKNTAVEAIEDIKKNESKAQIPVANDSGMFSDGTVGKGPGQMSNAVSSGNKKNHLQVISIEQSKKSVPYTTIPYSTPTVFIVGNETFGVLKEAMSASDYIAEIPMHGINISLNVIVSASIVMYHAYENLGYLK